MCTSNKYNNKKLCKASSLRKNMEGGDDENFFKNALTKPNVVNKIKNSANLPLYWSRILL
jgi:hypothetical protein